MFDNFKPSLQGHPCHLDFELSLKAHKYTPAWILHQDLNIPTALKKFASNHNNKASEHPNNPVKQLFKINLITYFNSEELIHYYALLLE